MLVSEAEKMSVPVAEKMPITPRQDLLVPVRTKNGDEEF